MHHITGAVIHLVISTSYTETSNHWTLIIVQPSTTTSFIGDGSQWDTTLNISNISNYVPITAQIGIQSFSLVPSVTYLAGVIPTTISDLNDVCTNTSNWTSSGDSWQAAADQWVIFPFSDAQNSEAGAPSNGSSNRCVSTYRMQGIRHSILHQVPVDLMPLL